MKKEREKEINGGEGGGGEIEREFKASGVLVCSLSQLSFPLHFELYRSPTQVKLCGDQLIHMLGIICRSGRQGLGGSASLMEVFEDQHLHRRRRRDVDELPLDDQHLDRRRRDVDEEEVEVREGEESAHRRRRRDIGLSTTCCMSSCTLRQLRLAC